MSIDGVKAGACAGAKTGQTIAEKIGDNKGKLLAAAIAPGALTAGIVADKWEKMDENAKEGVKMAAVLGTLIAGAAFLTGKANGQKGVKALTEGAKTLWQPIKEGFGKVKGELKTTVLDKAGKLKKGAQKMGADAKEKGEKLYSTVKKHLGKAAEKIKTTFTKTTEA